MIQKYAVLKFLILNAKYLSMPIIQLLSLTAHNHHSLDLKLYQLDKFALISGLKVNYDKTETLWIGSRKGSQTIFPSGKPILWAEEKVYALGVWFSTSVDKQLEANFMDKIIKLESISNSWSARRLTLLGKITIIKSLAVSQIV